MRGAEKARRETSVCLTARKIPPLSHSQAGFPEARGPGPRGMFVLFLLRLVAASCVSFAHTLARGLTRSAAAPPPTRPADAELVRGPRRGRSPRQVPPLCGGCAPKGGLRAALPTSALSRGLLPIRGPRARTCSMEHVSPVAPSRAFRVKAAPRGRWPAGERRR